MSNYLLLIAPLIAFSIGIIVFFLGRKAALSAMEIGKTQKKTNPINRKDFVKQNQENQDFAFDREEFSSTSGSLDHEQSGNVQISLDIQKVAELSLLLSDIREDLNSSRKISGSRVRTKRNVA